jgi:signal peptidase I
MATTEPPTATGVNRQSEKSAAKDTVVSVLISLVLAFVFRGFVVEAFQIPTGSMAPTLLGAHMRFKSPATGAEWTVAPWDYFDQNLQAPKAVQRGLQSGEGLIVQDPMSGSTITPISMPTLSGDRIFVLKYLYSIFDPERFDIVVFKNPTNPQENFIKRLIGLPNEQIALVDGDVFVRPVPSAGSAPSDNPWSEPGWKIARKPERVQRAVWQPVFRSEFTPKESKVDGRQWFFPPWIASTGEWRIADRAAYEYSGTAPTRLDWDLEKWPLTDRYPYNEAFHGGAGTRNGSDVLIGRWRSRLQSVSQQMYFPVSDIRVAAGIEPKGPSSDFEIAFNLVARGHEFQARLGKGKISLNMRPQQSAGSGGDGAELQWNALAVKDIAGLFASGSVTNVEFWHVDQSLEVWIDGSRALHADYDWSPAQRIGYATGLDPDRIDKHEILMDGTKYRSPGLSIAMLGSPVTLHRVGVWRDLHYQPTPRAASTDPGTATSPRSVLTTGPDHFFCCGDNSPSSHDGRSWNLVDPWVASSIDDTVGVVHRDLMIGKAFFVYFPAMDRSRRLPVPDVGRMRLIW